jgi:valyl-tRNA synthetase
MSKRLGELESCTRFEPAEIEPRIVERWLASGLFHPEPDGAAAENYSIAIPPPNVTGSLHMGHALNGSIQDVLIRYQRMKSQLESPPTRTKWILGTDHAGIATQAQVEKALRAEGTSRYELGREEFVRRAWEWREHYGHTIVEQFKRLGASCDYSEERFTLDEGYHRAVVAVFVELYEQGLIYRDRYIVNWDPGSRSAISDLEVQERRERDTLYSIRYDLEGGGAVTIATVRPETLLGDTAVAVHPDDERYRELVGRKAILPLVGRHLPILADEYVKMDFGTGQLKVTPAHDPNDFEIGQRHELDQVSVIGEDGRMTAAAGERFAGLTVMEARAAVVAALQAEGRIVGEEPYEHEVPYSHRSGERIEPLISLQWFMRMEELAQPAIEAVLAGRVRIVPGNHRRVYLDWMANIRPWCISRQLWWGHRLPVYYCETCGHVNVAADTGGLRGVRRGAAPRGGRPGHVVLLGAVAVRDAGVAAADATAARVLPDEGALDGARHPVPVGGADDHDGPALHRRGPLQRRLHPLGDPGAGRAADVEVAGDGHRPAGRDRAPRRGRGALRTAGDVLVAGRALLGGEGPAGPGAGEQAVQRGALRAAADREYEWEPHPP